MVKMLVVLKLDYIFDRFPFLFLAGNIFISRTSIPDTISEEGDDDESSRVVFKIGKKA